MKKAKIYFQHWRTNEKFIKEEIIASGKRRNIETEVLTKDDCNLLGALGVDIYLLHGSEFSPEEITQLRKRSPQSAIYCVFGEGYKMSETDRKLYDKVGSLRLFSDDNWHNLFSVLRESTRLGDAK